MSYNEPDPEFVDLHGDTPSGTTTGESGNLGVTLLPGKGESVVNSINENISVIINKRLSLEAHAEMYSYEANGHALMYILTRERKTSAHSYEGMTDVNFPLKNMILKSKKETIINMRRK